MMGAWQPSVRRRCSAPVQVAAAGDQRGTDGAQPATMDRVAEGYVKLVLAMGAARSRTTSTPTTGRRSGRRRRRRRSSASTTIAARAHGAAGELGQSPAGGRRDGRAAPPVSRAAAVGARGARPHAQGRAADVRRGVEGALRRRRADATPRRTSRQILDELEQALPGQRAARRRATTRSGGSSSSRASKLDAVFKAAIDGVPRAHAGSTSRCRPASSSRSSTSRTSRGAATTGTRAASAA